MSAQTLSWSCYVEFIIYFALSVHIYEHYTKTKTRKKYMVIKHGTGHEHKRSYVHRNLYVLRGTYVASIKLRNSVLTGK